jgi:hypothetical protein
VLRKYKNDLALVVHTCNPNYLEAVWEAEIEGIAV